MAAHGWRSHRALGTQLVEDFAGFDYYQLVRLSRHLLTRADATASEANIDARLDVRADLSAAFGAFEVSAFERNAYRDTVTLRSPNYCVAGSASPLPAPFVEWLRDLVRDGHHAMADFFDLFNRRVHMWRWRIKSRLHPGLHNAHPDQSDFADYLGAIIGLSDPELVRHLPLPRRALLGLAGLLADGRRSAATLTQSLTVLLGAKVRIEPLIGRWLAIDNDQRNSLGRTNSRLGENIVLGRRWFDPQGAVELRVAALPYTLVCDLLPGGERHDVLRDLLRLLTERRVDVWMVFTVLSDSAPRIRLSGNEKACAPRLGYTAVAGQRFAPGETREVRFLVPAFDCDGGEV
ncbi:MAG: type VI secretion system baseplate subunit TssG [Gammaproteobacteria bacterium]|nr:type VI secretion system baseplate subunit TssG [Gammaproteobacteria bacterium]MCP5135728.1 type VI secretion system baseplate subunit TssG [Gammaproteobacteria bacterium]